jgi:CRISPR-associated protein Cas2
MASRYPTLSGYRMMWLYVMFDLPVGTKAERKAATKFRNFLLDEGFEMAQFSVYLRFAESKEAAEVFIGHIREALPMKGKVHIVTITDKQYGNARIFSGKIRERRQQNPDQLVLF